MFAELSGPAAAIRDRLAAFMDEHVYPNERALLTPPPEAERWAPRPLAMELMDRARQAGLWNLFYNHGPEGTGLSNFEYGQLCEIFGRSLAAPEIFNCNAPDVGNMELLAAYGSPEQKERWLNPLLAGDIPNLILTPHNAWASRQARQRLVVQTAENLVAWRRGAPIRSMVSGQ